jgi:hypothetical protein
MAVIDPSTGLPTVESTNADARSILLSTLQGIFVTAADQPFIDQLMTWVDSQITSGFSVSAIDAALPNTEVYKTRFAGNEALKKAGYAPLSASEYLQAEKSYEVILRNAGLSNLAKRDTFASLIGGNVSAAEMENRVVNVFNRINNADTGLVNELESMLGTGQLNKTDLATSLLMGKQGTTWLQNKIDVAGISAEATLRGMNSALGAETLQQLGVSRQQAAVGFETVKQLQPQLQALGKIYGTNMNGIQSELEKEQFQGMLSQRRKQLTQAEENAFKGSSGIVTGSLSKSVSGQL